MTTARGIWRLRDPTSIFIWGEETLLRPPLIRTDRCLREGGPAFLLAAAAEGVRNSQAAPRMLLGRKAGWPEGMFFDFSFRGGRVWAPLLAGKASRPPVCTILGLCKCTDDHAVWAVCLTPASSGGRRLELPIQTV